MRALSGCLWACLLAGLSTGCVDDPGREPVSGGTNALDVCAQSLNGALCSDNQPCTSNDVCLDGKCIGTPAADGTVCTDGNVCTHDDQCLAAICVGLPSADGAACTDDDACTALDTCQQGRCQPGAPTVCDDGDSCTIDTCAPSVGCLFSPRDCAVPADAAIDSAIDAMTPDVMTPDAGDMPDAAVDAGPDGAPADGSGQADVRPEVDVDVDAAGPDAAGPDAADTGEADGGADTGPDAEPSDGRDAGADLVETPPDLRARGGGCNCATATAPGGGRPALATLALAVAWTMARRKKRARGREICAGARRR